MGATGNFGRVIIPRLLENSTTTSVLAIARRLYVSDDPRVCSVALDVRDPDLHEHLRGYDAVIHLAFIVEETRDKRVSHDINVRGTMNVVTAAEKAGVRHLVVASSVNAYGSEISDDFVTEDVFPLSDPGRFYFHDKSQIEHYIEWFRATAASPMSIVTLRCSFVVGPSISNIAIDAMCAKFAAIPEADRASYQFLNETDLAEAFALAVSDELLEGAYNVAPPDRTTMRTLASLHGQILVSLPMRVAVAAANLLYRLRLVKYSGHWVTAGDISVDSSRFSDATGWKSSTSSDENASMMLRLNGRTVRRVV
ncbi:NAD-dependent epimerase/dehydratase family protein [Rhodococcus tibetensis]|uniref:NAD-dependent epimerase/dehydratase family protein n=1 Tax=Rhodococcus tibetensis TaxID=2965064 RepID=A0ABT1Q9K6_9NOCA|nr:NAD-dependent epimerase/dehydratase family protein [Rhodococcus sp. FXJ9.536]MCQ4118938.1 NAD-dependent epimerase/dehydratase family protein [Rhodococcus sp. FXJ9.536]